MSARCTGCGLLFVASLLLALLFISAPAPVRAAPSTAAGARLSTLDQLQPVTVTEMSVYLPMISPGLADLLMGVDLGVLGGAESRARAVNSSGQVVGSSATQEEQGWSTHAFLWEGGAMRDLGTLGGVFSDAIAINDDGRIVGVSDIPGGAELRAFSWSDGQMADLGAAGGRGSWAADINARGQIIGGITTAAYDPRCFLWEDDKMIDLGTLGGAT